MNNKSEIENENTLICCKKNMKKEWMVVCNNETITTNYSCEKCGKFIRRKENNSKRSKKPCLLTNSQ